MIFHSVIVFLGGGLSAVIWTDFVQTILMVIGAFILMVFRLVYLEPNQERSPVIFL
jgi:Na+/proline symporter